MRLIIPPYWRTRLHRYKLIATKCKKCGRTAYPPSQLCRYCGSRDVEHLELINEPARLITWTVIYSAMEGFEHRRPVILGILETVETKVKLLAPLTDVAPSELSFGMLMEPVLRRINEEEEAGLIHYGIAYRPLIKSSQK
ncbi:MAG: Zn-ribbon domain-containing OB-fold protein [Desulfurococcaceae archaeon]